MAQLQGSSSLGEVVSANVLPLSFLAGASLHVLFYRHGEWDLAAPHLVFSYLSLSLVGIFLFGDMGLVLRLFAAHMMGIAASMAVYRVFFHRLKAFPGPIYAALSNLYVTVLSVRRFHLYEEVSALHTQYGDFVRLGPSELSITDPAAVKAIYGSGSPCTKGPWYNCTHPRITLQMIRKREDHIKRRKGWDKGFSAKALRDYEPRVKRYTDELVRQVDQHLGQPMNVSEWFNLYSFDVMMDLAFGKSFDLVKTGEKHEFIKSVHTEMLAIGALGHLPWMFKFLGMTPVVNRDHERFLALVRRLVEDRKKTQPDRPDVFSWILEDYEKAGDTSDQARDNLYGDAQLVVIAGSDTTAAVLSTAFFHIAQSSADVEKLRAELSAEFGSKFSLDDVDQQRLSKLKHLDAVINETMRMHPPVPSGVQRLTPDEGLQIGDTYIPGQSIVQVPMHSVFRDERCFVQPNEWIPDRWTTKPEMVKDSSSFVPFSIGPWSCVGKQLALMEVRLVISRLVTQYDISLAPDQTPEKFLDAKIDAFTLALSELNLVFRERNEIVEVLHK